MSRWRTALHYAGWAPVAVLLSDTVATLHVTPAAPSPSSSDIAEIPGRSLCLVRRLVLPGVSSFGHGHVVLVQPPRPGARPVARRVVALGGDLVQRDYSEDQYIPYGFVYLESDPDPSASSFSSSSDHDQVCTGNVPRASIVGKVTHVLFPRFYALHLHPRPSSRVFPSQHVELPAPNPTSSQSPA